MKNLFLIFLAPVFFSCGGISSEKPDSGNLLENFTFSMDTVVIDPKGEIIDLSFGIHRSSVSLDAGLFIFLI